MKIGIFDSGIGGLSVLRLAAKKLPDADFLYYADTDNVPYGEKSEDEVRGLAFSAAEFLISQGADAIVIACNTATSAAAASMRERLPVPIIGMEPAVKKALDKNPSGRILAAATPLTCRGGKLHSLIERLGGNGRIDLLPLPGLVRLAEAGDFSSADYCISRALAGFELSEYSALVLGCTHFLYFTDYFRRLLPDTVTLVDGNVGTVNQLLRIVREMPKSGCGQTLFFDSGRPASPESLLRTASLLRRLDKLDNAQ